MTRCRFVATTEPRIQVDRHRTDCAGGCDGCLPCTERHCHCGRHLTDQHPVTCPRCVGFVRDDLAEIITHHRALLTEAVHRGVNSEAMQLLGPAADPSSFGRRLAAAVLNDTYTEDMAIGEHHPLTVLGGWQVMWEDALDHHSDERITVEGAAAYLDRSLTYMAQKDEPDFEQFAAEVRSCRGHLEAVMHDQPQGDRANIGCFDCGQLLERRLTTTGFEDHWTCRGCHRSYTYAEYNFALRASLEAERVKREAS